jgi:hypothetical protein
MASWLSKWSAASTTAQDAVQPPNGPGAPQTAFADEAETSQPSTSPLAQEDAGENAGEKWSVTNWIQSIDQVSQVLSEALIRDLGDAPSGPQQLRLMREDLGGLTKEACKEAVLASFAKADVLDALAEIVASRAQLLATQRAATSRELHQKFEQEAGAFTLDFKGLATFYSGLEGVVR